MEAPPAHPLAPATTPEQDSATLAGGRCSTPSEPMSQLAVLLVESINGPVSSNSDGFKKRSLEAIEQDIELMRLYKKKLRHQIEEHPEYLKQLLWPELHHLVDSGKLTRFKIELSHFEDENEHGAPEDLTEYSITLKYEDRTFIFVRHYPTGTRDGETTTTTTQATVDVESSGHLCLIHAPVCWPAVPPTVMTTGRKRTPADYDMRAMWPEALEKNDNDPARALIGLAYYTYLIMGVPEGPAHAQNHCDCWRDVEGDERVAVTPLSPPSTVATATTATAPLKPTDV